MIRRSLILMTVSLVLASATGAACIGAVRAGTGSSSEQAPDTVVMPWGGVRIDSVSAGSRHAAHVRRTITALKDSSVSWELRMQEMADIDKDTRYTSLTDDDYLLVAEEMGVEVAVIKAVVRIEAGASLQGFYAPGVPVVNFDRKMYNKARPASNVKAPASEQVPEGITSAYGRKEWSQLVAARKVNRDKANMGAFWGMFQIGGFNYRLCGCESVQEFVDRMSYSEFEQLQLFVNFIVNSGMLADLKNKNWAAFARKYNGPSYKARGYHTRMAREYNKYKAEK